MVLILCPSQPLVCAFRHSHSCALAPVLMNQNPQGIMDTEGQDVGAWFFLQTPPVIIMYSHPCSIAKSYPTLPITWTVAHQASLPMGFPRQRILEQVVISSSRSSSQPRDQTHISCISCIGRWILYQWATWEADYYVHWNSILNKEAHMMVFIFIFFSILAFHKPVCQLCVQPQVYNVKNHGPCPQGVHNIKGEKMGANQGQLNTVKSCDQDGPDMLR